MEILANAKYQEDCQKNFNKMISSEKQKACTQQRQVLTFIQYFSSKFIIIFSEYLNLIKHPCIFPTSMKLSNKWRFPAQKLERINENKNFYNPLHVGQEQSSSESANIDILSCQLTRFYQLNPNLLSQTEISQQQRAKMRLWIVQNCYTQSFSTRTASLACYILDLYFSKGNNCSINQFHEFGICSLRIANKLEDNFYIPINYEVFSKDRLIEIEILICTKINFCLNPLTFTEVAISLHYQWNRFQEYIKRQMTNQALEVFQKTKLEDMSKFVSLEYSFVLLHQFLQLVYLILESLKYNLEVLVSNSFYLVFCLQFDNHCQQLTSSKINTYMKNDSTKIILWKAFMKFLEDFKHKLKLMPQLQFLEFLFPIYNDLISQQQQSKKGLQILKKAFDPNDKKYLLGLSGYAQTFHFSNKKKSLKNYLKRKSIQKVRKFSQVTDFAGDSRHD